MPKKFNNKSVACDWCGKKPTASTHFGTTHYTRFICEECYNEINEYHRREGVDNIIDKNDEARKEEA